MCCVFHYIRCLCEIKRIRYVFHNQKLMFFLEIGCDLGFIHQKVRMTHGEISTVWMCCSLSDNEWMNVTWCDEKQSEMFFHGFFVSRQKMKNLRNVSHK